MSYRDGTPIVIAGPCWPFCVLVTVPLIVVVTGLVSYFMIIDKRRFDLVCVSVRCLSLSDPRLGI